VNTKNAAQDWKNEQTVMGLIQATGAQINFVIDADTCIDMNTQMYEFNTMTYTNIVLATNGFMYWVPNFELQSFYERFTPTEYYSQAISQVILPRNCDSQRLFIPVDSYMQDFSFAITGAQPNVQLFMPNGTEYTNPFQILSFPGSYPGTTMVQVRKAAFNIAGMWSAVVISDSSSSYCACQVRGQSQLDLYFGFTQDLHSDTVLYSPMAYGDNYLISHVTSISGSGSVDYVEFFNQPNEVMVEAMPMNQRIHCAYDTISEPFVCPSNQFTFAVIGRDDQGYTWKRLATAQCQGSACDNGWDQNGQHCYHFNNQPTAWTDARDVCHGQNGELVSIFNAEKQTYLDEMVNGLVNTYWIGLNDRNSPDNWQWDYLHNPQPLDDGYTNWATGQPSGNGQCVSSQMSGTGTPGKWYDDPCTQNYPFVCQKHAYDRPTTGTSPTPPTGTGTPPPTSPGTQGTTGTPPSCDLKQVKQDIMFIIDSSSYMPSFAFEAIKSMVENFTTSVTVGMDNVRVGLITFDMAEYRFNVYNQNQNPDQILSVISNLRHTGFSGQNIYQAIQELISTAIIEDGFRLDDSTVGHMMVLFSSHSWTDGSPVSLMGNVRRLFINSIVVGYSTQADMDELNQLTSADCLIHAANTNTLWDQVLPFLLQKVCEPTGNNLYCAAVSK
jgi:hypothetical protein